MGVTKQAAQKRFVPKAQRARPRPGQGFGRFTARARNVVVAAQNEARAAGNDQIGPAHLVLGLLDRTGRASPRMAIVAQGVTLDAVREALVADAAAGGRRRCPALIPYDAAGEEGAGADLPRGPAARAQLRRHRAHPARAARARGRRRAAGRGRSGPRGRRGERQRDPVLADLEAVTAGGRRRRRRRLRPMWIMRGGSVSAGGRRQPPRRCCGRSARGWAPDSPRGCHPTRPSSGAAHPAPGRCRGRRSAATAVAVAASSASSTSIAAAVTSIDGTVSASSTTAAGVLADEADGCAARTWSALAKNSPLSTRTTTTPGRPGWCVGVPVGVDPLVAVPGPAEHGDVRPGRPVAAAATATRRCR